MENLVRDLIILSNKSSKHCVGMEGNISGKQDNTFLIKNKYDCNILNFKEIANVAFNSFRENNSKFKDHKLMVINTMQNNISSLLIHDFKFPSQINYCYKRCENLDFKT